MENSYAQALWQMISRGMDPKKTVRALKARLERDGRLRLFSRIGRVFERLGERELRKSRLTISIAHSKDESKALKAAREFFGKELPKDVKVINDNTLIGGWRVEGAGKLIDSSFKKYLLEIYNYATDTIPRRSGNVGNRGPDPLASGYNRSIQ